jgi:hypothetical protein
LAATADRRSTDTVASHLPSRAIARELLPGQRAAITGGVEGRRRHTVYLRWEATYRNQLWQADHKELPVLVLAPKARRPSKPWVTLLLDAYSRLVMGWAIAPLPVFGDGAHGVAHGHCRRCRTWPVWGRTRRALV